MAISVSKDLIAPFVDAVSNVFNTMIDIQIEKQGAYLLEEHKVQYDVSGVMGITGKLSGTIAVSFPKKLSCQVVSALLGEKLETFDETVVDGIGEVVNMISGDAKRLFENNGMGFEISLPAVVVGSNHKISSKSNVPHVLIVFQTGDGDEFAVQLALQVEY